MVCKNNSCHSHNNKIDYIFWFSLITVVILYITYMQIDDLLYSNWLYILAKTTFEFINRIWWGILIGIVMVGILSKIPREFIISIFGKQHSFKGILRATIAGVFLDLCNHGILMVASKLYERGASIGQVIAFLISSPWNSFSFTIILFSLVGLKWTLFFIIFSMVIAIITGVIFDKLVINNKLPANPNSIDLPDDFNFFAEAKKRMSVNKFNKLFFVDILRSGILDSRMVIKWILFGVLLAGIIRAFVDVEIFQNYLGPTILGLVITLMAATIIEVCSEGSIPIASDIFNIAKAPGNSFAFLMTGVATDYTEIMVLKETTKSWKITLLVPLITVPQIIIISYIMNRY